jgi:very-short-patch-repair endonuclease
MNKLPLFERSFASHKRSKFWSERNGDVKPENVFKSSHKPYWFDCDKCDHSFDCALNNIVAGKWCSYCSNKELCKNLECIPCFNKSFASHKQATFWSEKNGGIKPRYVFEQSNKIYWFDCHICKHSFDSSLNHVTAGRWCRYCSHNELCKTKDCKFCFNNSFASHEKAEFWSEKNEDVKPRDVFICSGKIYWFNCDKCKHCFDSALSNIIAGNWCSYCCVPSRQLCENQECTHCLTRSFASHEKVKFWSKKNEDVNPRNVFKSSRQRCWFDCDRCNHSFDIPLYCIIAGVWCPFCKHKTELKLYDVLKAIYPTLITQFKKEWCKKRVYLPFDFCIPEFKIIIELDGRQHFTQVSNWASPEETFKTDLFKEKCANDNGYSVIRILQEDVFNDTYDWKKELYETIEELINGDEIANVYLCKNGEYDKF